MAYILFVIIYASGGNVEIHTQNMNDELSCKLAANSVKYNGNPSNRRAFDYPEIVSFCVMNGVDE